MKIFRTAIKYLTMLAAGYVMKTYGCDMINMIWTKDLKDLNLKENKEYIEKMCEEKGIYEEKEQSANKIQNSKGKQNVQNVITLDDFLNEHQN